MAPLEDALKKVFLLELNEFNLELMETAATQLDLKHVQKILSFYRTHTLTKDSYESDFLEPWVQWVSVHTGIPSEQHHIKHLGDVPALKTKQLWERLAERGVTSGVWGAMNAACHETSLFFFPDPWTASERASPDELNQLLEPLRYLSKNYVNCSYFTIAKQLTGVIKLLIKNKLGCAVCKELPALIKQIIHFRGKPFVWIAFIEFLALLLFLRYQKRYDPDFSLLFLNTIAHLQHHHWKTAALSEPLAHGFRMLDRMLGELFTHLSETHTLIIANALSQTNTDAEKPWILYRQIDQSQFLATVGIAVSKIESLMTHDALLFFSTAAEAADAQKALEGATLEGQKLFLVESYPEAPLKLFYRILFTDEVKRGTTFSCLGRSFDFLKLFRPIVRRTGKHIPQGTVLCNEPHFPPSMMNHELFHEILKLCKSDIQADYDRLIPAKLAAIQQAIHMLHHTVTVDNLKALRFLVHKMGGNAGTFGYMQVSQQCLVWDQRLSQMIEQFPQCQQDVSWQNELDLFLVTLKRKFSCYE